MCRPFWNRRWSAAGSVAHRSRSWSNGGPAAQFEDDVVLGPGDDHGPADGPAALRDDRAQADLALEEQADAPPRRGPAAEHQPAVARAVDAAGHAAEDRDVGHVLVEAGEELVGGERVGVAQEQDRRARTAAARAGRVAGGEQGVGPAHQAGAVGRALEREVERVDGDGLRPLREPEAQRGPALDLAAVADDGLGHAAEDRAGVQPLRDGRGDLGGVADVVRREEDDGEVGRAGEGGAGPRRPPRGRRTWAWRSRARRRMAWLFSLRGNESGSASQVRYSRRSNSGKLPCRRNRLL